MTADELIKVLSERLNLEGLSFGDKLVAGISVNDMAVDFERDEDDTWLYVHGEVIKNASSLSKEKLLSLLDTHEVELVWVKGHDGHPYNERCDKLATAFADSFPDPVDDEPPFDVDA